MVVKTQEKIRDGVFFVKRKLNKRFEFILNYDADTNTTFGKLFPTEDFQGGDGRVIHDGFLAIILEEAMLAICEKMNLTVYPLRTSYRFLRPAAVKQPLYVRAWFVKSTGDIFDLRAEIENEMGKAVARAKSRYIDRELYT